jgi:Rad3-related DNA helicase
MSILSHCPPGWSLRPEQCDVLLRVEAAWKDHEIIVLTAPTAFGKTLTEVTIARWRASFRERSNIMTRDNSLVEQIHGSFPDITLLRRKESYEGGPIPHSVARIRAKEAMVRLMNFHVAFSNRLQTTNHMLDEGHLVADMLEDRHEVRIWQRDFPFLDGLVTVADVIEWAQSHARTLDPDTRLARRLRRAVKDITAVSSDAEVRYDRDLYRGRVSRVIRVIPGIERKPPDWLWPRGTVRKLVFLSATMSREDIRELGLSGRRVAYIECPSPIPVENRPILYRPWVNMGREYQERAVPEFARRLQHELDTRPDKGMVHLPYALADWLHEIMGDHPRLMWHDKDNKLAVLDQFRASPPEDGKVLVASGMYEGIDLPFDAARWQVIGKVPYLSLGDEKVRKRQQAHPDWYDWCAIRSIVQAAGRIVRAPTDYGETLIWDTNFEMLWRKDKRRKEPLFPKFFRDAVKLLPR